MEKYIIDDKEAAQEFWEWLSGCELTPRFNVEGLSIIAGDEEFIFEGEAKEIFDKYKPNRYLSIPLPVSEKVFEQIEDELEKVDSKIMTASDITKLNDIQTKRINEVEKKVKDNLIEDISDGLEKIIIEQKDRFDNPLIFGKNKTKGVVAIEVVDNEVWLFKNDGTVDKIPNEYWIASPRSTRSSERLEGNLHYKHIMKFEDKPEFMKARAVLYSAKADFYSIGDPQESAMVYNGITCFKGLRTEDVSVLSFDIEANGLIDNETGKPIVGDEAEVYMISNTFRGTDGKIVRKVFTLEDHDESCDMILEWCEWVIEVDPSIICGHNIFGYDLPYLSYCKKMIYGGDLQLGRDCSVIKYGKRPSKFRKDGSQTYDYFNAQIFGRHVIDTMFLAIKYDFGRKYPNYTLKGIIEFEGLVKEGRQFYDACKIADNWSNPEERAKIIEYGKDDADDALALYDLMIPQFFYYAQSIPKPFQKINNSATGSQINSFLVRSYLQVGHSIPKQTEAEKYEGGISFGNPGVWEHVAKVDVASLYPSIMITEEVYDRDKDPKANFLEMVKYFTNERLENKKLGNETGDRYYKDVEQGQKIVINSAYGMLGATGLLFNSPKWAAFVTKTAREICQKGIDWAEKKEFQIVNADTDSFSYTTGKKLSDEDFEAHITEINNLFKAGIIWEDDGRYKTVLVVKAKNYALKSYNKKKAVKIKGSALKATMKETALCDFICEIMDLLLNNKKDQLFQLYNHYAQEIVFPEIDITRWCSKKTVTKAVLKPERTTEARLLAAISGKNLKEGDKFYVYFTNNEEVPVRLREDYEGDHDAVKLLKKLYNTLKVFETVVDVDCYPNYSLKRNQKLIGVE